MRSLNSDWEEKLTSLTSGVMAGWPADKAEMGRWLPVSRLQTSCSVAVSSVALCVLSSVQLLLENLGVLPFSVGTPLVLGCFLFPVLRSPLFCHLPLRKTRYLTVNKLNPQLSQSLTCNGISKRRSLSIKSQSSWQAHLKSGKMTLFLFCLTTQLDDLTSGSESNLLILIWFLK